MIRRDIAGVKSSRSSEDRVVQVVALLWGGIGVALALVAFRPSEWQATLGILMVSQAFCGAWTWQRLRAAANATLPDFLTVFLLFEVVSKTVTALNLIVRAAGIEVGTIALDFDQLTESTNTYRWQAEWAFVSGTIMFALGWKCIEKRRPLFVWKAPKPKVLWWTYGVFMAVYLGVGAARAQETIGVIHTLSRLLALGALTVLLSGDSRYAMGRERSWISLLALAPLLALALQSGVKGEFGVACMPVLLPIVRRISVGRIIGLISFAVVVVMVVFPFSWEVRGANWISWGGSENISLGEVSRRVFARWETEGYLTTAAESATQFLARGSTADIGGLVMSIADTDGHIGGELIEDLKFIFFPRFLWSDKPSFSPGAWFTSYLGQARTPDEAMSATAIMLSTEMYWMYGWWAVWIGMALLGILYALCWKWLILMSERNVVPLIALFALLMRASDLMSSFVLYAIAVPITYVVYVYAFLVVHKVAFPNVGLVSEQGIDRRAHSIRR